MTNTCRPILRGPYSLRAPQSDGYPTQALGLLDPQTIGTPEPSVQVPVGLPPNYSGESKTPNPNPPDKCEIERVMEGGWILGIGH